MKTLLVNFRNMYGFLSQDLPYQDFDLEQLRDSKAKFHNSHYRWILEFRSAGRDSK